MSEKGFSLFELLLVIALLGIFLLAIPGVEKRGLNQLSHQEEVRQMVDMLRWAQRRAILQGERQYLTLDPETDQYRIYELRETEEIILREIAFQGLDLLGLNRTIAEREETFYYTPLGTPVFGCTISLQDEWTSFKVVIAVSSGKVRIERG